MTDICRCLGISRSSYYRNRKSRDCAVRRTSSKSRDDEVVLSCIKELKLQHPFWGYRRIWAHLRYRQGIYINKKRAYRLMRENDLLCSVKRCKAKRRSNNGKKPRAVRPLQFWGIDMSKVMIQCLGWAYFVVIIDWYSRRVVGWSLKLRSRSSDWLEVLEEAVLREFPDGTRGKGLQLISDNGNQPTSKSFHERCKILGIEQIFTSYGNPRGNAETERFIRTFKEEVVWPVEFVNFEEAVEAIKSWIEYYNEDYVHSSLGYMSPIEFEKMYYAKVA